MSGADALPLFTMFPGLARGAAHVSIGHWPTPVAAAPRFAAAHGLRSLYIKFEGRSHPTVGGNKVRGLEFLLGAAKRRGRRTILTLSAAGSHHVSRTAWHARQLDLGTVAVVVPQAPAEYVRRSILLGAAAGARYVPAGFATAAARAAFEYARRANRTDGQPPFVIPPGGTSPLACLGHVNAALELKRQIDEGLLPAPDYLYVALGSLGTAAGLAVGLQLAGLATQVVGVVVSYRWYCTSGRWVRLALRTLRRIRRCDGDARRFSIDRSRLHVVGTALGAGYARFTEESAALAAALHDAEGIVSEGTYTAKALHGMMRFIGERRLHGERHLFWHTYHPLAIPPDASRLVAALPPALRRYFDEPVQGLDGRFACE